jgi:hypothetical protein
VNAAEKRKRDHAYYLANKARWSTVYSTNRKRVLARAKKLARPRRNFWSAEDEKVFRRIYPHHESEWVAGQLGRTLGAIYGHAQVTGIQKTPAYTAASIARVSANLNEGGKAHRFQKGVVPANKGLRRPGWHVGRMKETQFKKGESRNRMPLFSERISFGYILVKVAEVPNVPYFVNWLAVHVLNWERANGRPVPPGHCLWFRDRNRMNTELDNLELITRAENMRRNTVHNLPKEIAQVVQLRGALVRQINKRSGNEKRN